MWSSATLGELCDWRKGRSAAAQVGAGPYPLFTTAAGNKTSASFDFEGEAVIVPLVSATGHGNAAIARLHHARGKFALATILAAGFPRNPDVCSRYIWLYLTYAKDWLLVPLMQGTANVSLSIEKIQSVEIPVPSLDEQRRIVARLDAVAARLAARAAAAERQEAELAAMLRVLARTDTTPTPMRELLTLRPTDVEVRPEGQYQFSGVYSFGRGVFRSQRKSGADFAYPRLTTLRAGDFTYPKLMAWEGAYGIVPPECDGTVVSPEFPVFAVNAERVPPEVLALHFGDPQTWPRLSGASTGTNARRRRLHPETLLAYEMPLPAPSVQSLLQEVIAKATAVRALNATTADDAAALLPAMLHDIFGGTGSAQPSNP